VLLAIGINVFLVARPAMIAHSGLISAFFTPTLLLLAAACWFAWEKLADTELKRIRDQAKLLHEMDELESAS